MKTYRRRSRCVLSTAPAGATFRGRTSASHMARQWPGRNPGAHLTVSGVSEASSIRRRTGSTVVRQFSSRPARSGPCSTDFVHPTQLELRDSSSGSGFSAISKASGSPRPLPRQRLRRRQSLATSVCSPAERRVRDTGADNATVTFTLVVPLSARRPKFAARFVAHILPALWSASLADAAEIRATFKPQQCCNSSSTCRMTATRRFDAR